MHCNRIFFEFFSSSSIIIDSFEPRIKKTCAHLVGRSILIPYNMMSFLFLICILRDFLRHYLPKFQILCCTSSRHISFLWSKPFKMVPDKASSVPRSFCWQFSYLRFDLRPLIKVILHVLQQVTNDSHTYKCILWVSLKENDGFCFYSSVLY